MAYRASVQAKVEGFAEANNTARALKSSAQDHRDNFVTEDQSANAIFVIHLQIVNAIEVFGRVRNISGMLQYARDQFDDPTYDIVTEFDNMILECESARDWVTTNTPNDGSANEWLTVRRFDTDGSFINRTFTVAQLVSYVTELDNIIASIN